MPPSTLTPRFLRLVLLLVAIVLVPTQARPSDETTTAAVSSSPPSCLGSPLLCNVPYNLVTLAGTHASHAVRKDEDSLGTQDKGIKQQLADGIRALYLEVYPSPADSSTAELCFMSCAANDGGTLAATLQVITDFLNAEATEMLTIVVSNPGEVATEVITKEFKAQGLDTIAYVGPALGNWPTVSSLLANGKRIVVFGDKSVASLPSWMANYETMTQYTQLVVPPDDKWPMGRINYLDGKVPFFINYHLRWTNATVGGAVRPVPYAAEAAITNSWDLVSHIVDLRNNNFIWPHLVAVDFYDVPGCKLFDMVRNFNGVPIPGNQPSNFYPITNKAHTKVKSVAAPTTAGIGTVGLTLALLVIVSLCTYRI
ncbi:hypothetical protein IWQ60_004170 [Tieghemiomyces parasiticus]|uniref:Uncharacterized protein n=1 Tax=Tieghemiomyces parasiticus TaxID=78921 RepID=A0A9W8DU51_9FUNG|nr:hypothetical protein IWQ60_004170 [Tieghemiomyces parasiticus]